VGKTTLGLNLARDEYPDHQYLNWDIANQRKKIILQRFSSETELIIFDEIHKYAEWKNYLKGICDDLEKTYSVLVTGSARLNTFKKRGDSLMGRYFYYRLHPLSLREIANQNIRTALKDFPILASLEFPKVQQKEIDILNDLLEFGGFPEMYLGRDKSLHRRRNNEKINQLTNEDVKNIGNIKELSLFQVLLTLMPERVSSLFSTNSLREDLQVSFNTIKSWIEMLENFYYCFRLYPFNESRIKSLKKEPKLYLWDWSEIEDNEGGRFENLIASHLLKFVHFLHDIFGYKVQLSYLRDREGRETDFIVSTKGKPWFAVEAKWNSEKIDKNLLYFKKKMQLENVFQVIGQGGVDFMEDGVRVISASKFLMGLV